MADVIPMTLNLQCNRHLHLGGGSRHLGHIMHGRHEVKVAHKCDAFDAASDAAPLTQESKTLAVAAGAMHMPADRLCTKSAPAEDGCAAC